MQMLLQSTEAIGYADGDLKFLVTGIFATFLLFAFFAWFIDFLSLQGDN